MKYNADTDPRYAELMAEYVRAEMEREEADRIYMLPSTPPRGHSFDRWIAANESVIRAKLKLGKEYPGALEDA